MRGYSRSFSSKHRQAITHAAEPDALTESLVNSFEAPSVVGDLDHEDVA